MKISGSGVTILRKRGSGPGRTVHLGTSKSGRLINQIMLAPREMKTAWNIPRDIIRGMMDHAVMKLAFCAARSYVQLTVTSIQVLIYTSQIRFVLYPESRLHLGEDSTTTATHVTINNDNGKYKNVVSNVRPCPFPCLIQPVR